MDKLKSHIRSAQNDFRNILLGLSENSEGIFQDQYVNYLSMQYHLTKGVQRYFFAAASHQSLCHRRALRDFLVGFACEEELHFKIAQSDIESLGFSLRPITLDVELWHAYFEKNIQERPFLRLGATCILENIADGAQDVISKIFSESKFITPRNSAFFTIHRHQGNQQHGTQILTALESANLTRDEITDLELGAKAAKNLYMRMLNDALYPEV